MKTKAATGHDSDPLLISPILNIKFPYVHLISAHLSLGLPSGSFARESTQIVPFTN